VPEWKTEVRARLAGLRLGAAREAEIVEELSQHLDQRYEELRANGAGDAEARRLAVEELLETHTLVTSMRRLRQANAVPPVTLGGPRLSWREALWQDLRFAARSLRRQPGFAAAAILTLALGIGANGAIFALVDATLLRPLPFSNPDRLVKMWERTDTDARGRVSPLNMTDWTARNRTFDAIGGYIPGVGGMVMNGPDGTAETVPRQWATSGIFDALNVRPLVGRTFRASDDRDRADVVVLAEGFWRARFNGDASVVGREIRFDGTSYTVVGVVPEAAQVLGRTSIWAMVSMNRLPAETRTAYFLHAIGRLKPGVTLQQAEADMAGVAAALAKEFPKTNASRDVALEPLREAVVGLELRQTSLLFLGVVGFVLLICCANVANLLMTRATARVRELAIRSALGADRLRVIRQLLTESLLLSLVGGILGVAIGMAILSAARAVIPPELLPAGVTVAFDPRVLGFCAATALAVGVVFGLAPAWHATSGSSAHAMASEGRGTTGRGSALRGLLVVGEVATAVVLLFGAGLLLRTLLKVEGIDRGYRAESVLTMIVDPLSSQYDSNEKLMQFYQTVEQEVMTAPGVRSVAWATTLPLGDSVVGTTFVEIVGEAAPDESDRPIADYQIVSPGYFQTLDLPVVEGRGFDDRDIRGATPVCIVNEAFVRRFMRGRSPLGVRVGLRSTAASGAPTVVRQIVGVARQVKGRPDETEDLLQVYIPIAQRPLDDTFLVVRPQTGPAEALAPAVRAAIGRVDKDQLVSVRDVMTLDDVARQATSRHRFRAALVSAFAALALLLAMVGVFGVLAYSVQQRVRDFGVRRVLGATTTDVLHLVIVNALRVVGLGTVIGLAAATVLGRLLTAMLFGVEPLDPATYVLVAAVLALTAAASIVAPAWRAARIDPAVALRAD
jgi:putative ABC transport system permease protein